MIKVSSRSSRLAAMAALPILLAAKPLAAPVVGGTTYEFVVHSMSAKSGNKESVMMRGKGTFAGSDARIDILETASQLGSETFGGKGSYFLVREGGKKMLLVDPAKKQYMEWEMASMLAGLSTVLNAVGGLVKLEISDVKIDAHNLGAGGTLRGYPTVHYRMVENYTVSAKVFGRSSKSRSETTTDYYFAPSLKGLANPFMASGRQMAQAFDMFNNPDYKNQMAAAQAKIQYGVPLKAVVKTVTTDDAGKQQVNVVTSEMVNFKNGDVPRSTFSIPDDYKMVEMPKLDAITGGGADTGAKGGQAAAPDVNVDSATAAAKAGAGNAVKEAVKEGAKEEAKKKILKGIFKR